MFISSLTLTAVFWACVCFCIVRVSATTTTTSTPSSGAGTQASPRGGKHHHHQQQQHHQEREDSKDRGSSSGGRSHSLKIHNFISTDALYDGEQERRIHYKGITAKETAVSTAGTANSTRLVISWAFALMLDCYTACSLSILSTFWMICIGLSWKESAVEMTSELIRVRGDAVGRGNVLQIRRSCLRFLEGVIGIFLWLNSL